MKLPHPVVLIVLLAGLSAIASERTATGTRSAQKTSLIQMDSPAGPGSGEPNLSVARDGRVYLSWLEPIQPKGHALRYAVRNKGGTWSAPRTIAGGENWFVNWADFPSIVALSNGTLAAHWLAKSGPGTYAYNVNVSLSHDGGTTWSKTIVPHRDGTQTEHGFVSMLPTRGGLEAVWLDGRKMKGGEHGASGHGAATDEMSLMHTIIRLDGTLGAENVLDTRVCECCQTSAAATHDGMAVVYRDRSDKEVRDIYIVRQKNGRWSAPQNLSNDGWEINGCPVNGPAISSSGQNLAVAWFTAVREQPRVYAVLSADGGETFSRPVAIDDGDPIGRVDIVSLPSKDALVSWVERTAKGAQVRARVVKADGTRGFPIVVSDTNPARSSGFPRMERSGDEVVFAWTDSGNAAKVRTAILKITGQ